MAIDGIATSSVVSPVLGACGILPLALSACVANCLPAVRPSNTNAYSYVAAAGLPPCSLRHSGCGAFGMLVPAQSGAAVRDGYIEFSRHILARQFEIARLRIGKRNFGSNSPVGIGVLSLSGMGGSGKVARDYAQAMAGAGHRVYLYCASTSFFPMDDLPDVTMVNARVPDEPRAPEPSWTSALAEDICRSVCREGIDVVHVHYVAGLLEAALVARQRLAEAGKPIRVIATLHGSDVSNFGRNPDYRPAIARQLASCDAVTAVSMWLAAEAKKVFGLRDPPVTIWNSVDVGRFNPGQWSDLRQRVAPDGENVLCHASNFRPVKRAVDTVEIQARLMARGIPTKLLLIGKGPDVARAKERAMELGTHHSVTATGPLPPNLLAKYVAASDIALVTSESESFSLAALEAMSCGVPVVGTRCGGIEEVVDGIDWKIDGASRLLAGVGDVDSMAEICASLLQDSEIYWSVQRQGVFASLTRFHADRQTEGYLDLVERVSSTE